MSIYARLFGRICLLYAVMIPQDEHKIASVTKCQTVCHTGYILCDTNIQKMIKKRQVSLTALYPVTHRMDAEYCSRLIWTVICVIQPFSDVIIRNHAEGLSLNILFRNGRYPTG